MENSDALAGANRCKRGDDIATGFRVVHWRRKNEIEQAVAQAKSGRETAQMVEKADLTFTDSSPRRNNSDWPERGWSSQRRCYS